MNLNEQPKVSVVVATLNRQELLIEMLTKLLQDQADILEIIIVDQTEEFGQELKDFIDSHPIIKYFYFKEKKLTAARNFGWQKAQGEIVLFLDDDAMIFPGLVRAHLQNYQDENVGAVTGKEVLADNLVFETSGRAQEIKINGEIIHNPTAQKKGEVDSCWGANMSMRREIIEKLGGFDYDILLIRDESDLSMRLRLAGYKIIFEPAARIIHKTFKSGGTRFDKRMDWYFKFFHDEMYFQLKFFSWRYLPSFYLRKLRPILACMFWYGRAHPRALMLPFRAFKAGKKTYQKNQGTVFVPKRIGVDAHHLMIQIKTGKEEYGYNLLRELGKNHQPDLFFIYAKTKPDFKLSLSNLAQFDWVNPYKFNWRKIKWPSFLWYLSVLWQTKLDGVQVLFCPTSYVLAALNPKISLPIVHDLAILRRDFKSKARARLVEKKLLKRIIRCPQIITVSHFTKIDLIKHFPQINPRKISVVYPGVNFKNSPKESEAKNILAKLKINKPYILGVGTIEPRKNFQGLIRAYLSLPENLQQKYDLVFSGKPGWENEEIYKLAQPVGDRIKFLGYLEKKDLAAVFSQASMFVLPSFWEGFGIPILEAFHFKVPVICSNVSSLPEVAGDAAILINPHKIHTIKEAIIKLDNQELRAELIKKGQERLMNFSYNQSARELNKILKKFPC
jgi:glycosyltransferase involved in cell wall biosynthesis